MVHDTPAEVVKPASKVAPILEGTRFAFPERLRSPRPGDKRRLPTSLVSEAPPSAVDTDTMLTIARPGRALQRPPRSGAAVQSLEDRREGGLHAEQGQLWPRHAEAKFHS